MADPVLPRAPKHRTRLIFNTMIATRAQQLTYNDQKRTHDMAVKCAEQEVEAQQLSLTREAAAREAAERRRKTSELHETYRTQLSEIEQRKRGEITVELAQERSLRAYEAEQDRFEAQKAARQQALQRAHVEEFRRHNNELLIRKQDQIDQGLAEERRILQEAAELQETRDRRAAEDVRRRLERTNTRASVADAAAASHAERVRQDRESDEAAGSDFENATFASVIAMKDRQNELEDDRHREWIILQKEREARKRDGKAKPFPAKRTEVDADAFDRRQRKIESARLQDYLRQQMLARKAAEEREMQLDRERDEQMLAATQEQFNRSLNKLQTLIPPEAGLAVPTYTVSRSITKCH
jgi:hypothetical protein